MKDLLLISSIVILSLGIIFSQRDSNEAKRAAYEAKLQLKCFEALSPKK